MPGYASASKNILFRSNDELEIVPHNRLHDKPNVTLTALGHYWSGYFRIIGQNRDRKVKRGLQFRKRITLLMKAKPKVSIILKIPHLTQHRIRQPCYFKFEFTLIVHERCPRTLQLEPNRIGKLEKDIEHECKQRLIFCNIYCLIVQP